MFAYPIGSMLGGGFESSGLLAVVLLAVLFLFEASLRQEIPFRQAELPFPIEVLPVATFPVEVLQDGDHI